MTTLAKSLFALVLVAVVGLSTASFAGLKSDIDLPMNPNGVDPYDRSVDFVNLSNHPIWSIQISNVDDDTWPDEDLLADETIDGKGNMWLSPTNPNGYCRFDALVTYADGTQVEVWDVNFCDVSTIQVKDNGFTRVMA